MSEYKHAIAPSSVFLLVHKREKGGINKMQIEEDVKSIIKKQNELEAQEQAIYKANPEIFAQIKAIEEAKLKVDDLWNNLKSNLQKVGDYDSHEIEVGDYVCRYTLSKTVKIAPKDIDKVPEEYVSIQKVADEKKLKKHYELYGEIPSGCEDKSYDRLVKKITLKKGE